MQAECFQQGEYELDCTCKKIGLNNYKKSNGTYISDGCIIGRYLKNSYYLMIQLLSPNVAQPICCNTLKQGQPDIGGKVRQVKQDISDANVIRTNTFMSLTAFHYAIHRSKVYAICQML